MKDNRVYLIHIRDCIVRIESYLTEGKAGFLKDLKTQDAVIRNLQTLCNQPSAHLMSGKQHTLNSTGGELLISEIY